MTTRRRRLGHGAYRSRGQAVVEFAIIAVPFLILLFGILDFGMLFESRLALSNAVRQAARFGAVKPMSWSAANPAPSGSIEGQLQAAGGTTGIPNDDAHIKLVYLIPQTGGTATQCGHFYVVGGYGSDNGYSQSDCVKVGNMIQVTTNYKYPMFTPLLAALYPGGIQIQTQAAMLIEAT
jgi:hypothetical protein